MNTDAPAIAAIPPPEAEHGVVVGVRNSSWNAAFVRVAGAAAAFHLAYAFTPLRFLIVVYLYCLVLLAELPTPRMAFYSGLALGYAVYAPHLTFFWKIFGWPAVVLWTVLAFWLGLFVALARLCRNKYGRLAVALVPFVWTGFEYFRSELYYLRFSWLNVGYAFSGAPEIFAATHLGMYGVGLALMTIAASMSLAPKFKATLLLCAGSILAGLALHPGVAPKLALESARNVEVAGVQLEFPAPFEVPAILDVLLARYPAADLLVLSEYTFDGPIPAQVQSWCRQHRKYLLAGGKDFLSNSEFFNTAFVVGPDGDIVFRQVKSVPIQFFKDGQPARKQELWRSPWGKLGICICYDLSYRQVTDELIRQGAEAILVPTMDVADWGESQHKLHARVAPIRAAEYGVPIFRLCSSGISQVIDRAGNVTRSAPAPGDKAMIAGALDLVGPGRLPFDAWLAPLSVAVTAALIFWFSAQTILGKFSKP